MIKFCIFDLDGTLFNTLTTITHYMNEILVRHEIRPISEEECRGFIGHGARTLMKRALASRGIFDEDIGAGYLLEYNALYNTNTLYLTAPYKNIPELINALHMRGIGLGVLSNKPDDTTNDIVKSFFPNIFDDIRGGRAGVALKPSPEALISMAEDNGIALSEIMYIGDTGVDIEAGRSASVGVTVGVSWGFRTREELIGKGADIIVDDPMQILSEVISRG